MKLQTKTTIIILLIFFIFTVIVLAMQALVVIPKFEKININKAYADIDEGLRVIDDELNNMTIITGDYAVWDDTYQFTKDGNNDYIIRNFTANVIENLNMSYIGIYGVDSLLYSFNTFADSEDGSVLEQGFLNQEILKTNEANGFITINDKTCMFASQMISTTDQVTQSNSHFIFSRDYLDHTNEKLSTIPGTSLEIIEFSSMTAAEKKHVARVFENIEYHQQESYLATETVYEMPDEDFIVALTYLYDINGKPFAVLKSNTSNATIRESRSLLLQTAFFFPIVGMALAFMVALYINRSIIKPINGLKKGLHLFLEHGNITDIMKDISAVSRTDEIGDLTKNLIAVTEEIMTAREASENTNANLENIVLERTQEIASAHKELILYGEVFEETSDGVIITDIMGSIVKCNKAFMKMSGYQQSDIQGQTPEFLLSNGHDPDFYKSMEKYIIDEGKWEGEVWSEKKNGCRYPVWLVIDTIKDDNGNPSYFVGVLSDISTKKDMEKQLEKMAFYDMLTGLPNRSLFYEHFIKAIARAATHNFLTAVLYIDLDGFKLVNDTFGHANGDIVLVEIGKRIKKHIQESDLVSRIGGDEFTVVLESFRSKNDLAKMAKDLLAEISKDFIISGETISISASIGIAIFPEDGDTLEEIITNADSAMYLAKVNGKNCYSFASNIDKTKDVPKIIRINRLKKATENSEFHLVYQPQIKIDGSETEIFGAEALIRWTDDNGITTMPNDFIYLAEETGLIMSIGQWVIEEACKTIRELEKLDKKIHISVNVSIRQFKSKNLIEIVKSAIENNNINPQHLFIEITESIFADNEPKVLSTIKELKALGVKIVLDDFGTGYSSLSVISKLPFDMLKVDKSFVQNFGLKDEKNLGSIIILMAELLNMQSIIEGVETVEQVDYYKKNGGVIFQGYYFSRPLEKAAFMDFIN
ncbi:MAG: EAL domain-containing protein [Acetobacterium sp.]